MKEKVLELEKQGTKLYGLLPFPFFILLLRNLDNVKILVDYMLWNWILPQCGMQASRHRQQTPRLPMSRPARNLKVCRKNPSE